MKRWFKDKIFLGLLSLFCLIFATVTFANEDEHYVDRTQLVTEQVSLLKYRLAQTNDELGKLQRQRDNGFSSLSINTVKSKDLLSAQLDIAVAKSNLASVTIELSESQQTIMRLENDTAAFENQLNVMGIFGSKIIHMGAGDATNLRNEFAYQKKLLELEKKRFSYLQSLQGSATKILQLSKVKHTQIETLLKTQSTIRLKERQAKSEMSFQREQAAWMQKLNNLNDQLTKLESTKQFSIEKHEQLIADIFYANENVNFSYLQMLVARYQDQIQELKNSIVKGGSSIAFLNNTNDQVQLLTKQLARVSELLTTREAILEKRKQYHFLNKTKFDQYFTQIDQLKMRYQTSAAVVVDLNQSLIDLKNALAKAMQQELSSRQGLPGLDGRAWLDLGAEILLLPSLAFHVIKSLARSFVEALQSFSGGMWLFLGMIEISWLISFYYLRSLLHKIGSTLHDHEFGHVSLKWLCNKLLTRHLVEIALIGNMGWVLYAVDVPIQSFAFVVNISLVWLFFRMITTLSRLYLVETLHDRAGADVRLYHLFKWTFIVGGITTGLAVFMRGLPVSYEMTDLFSRFFLLFLLIISLVLLRSWEVLPGLIIPHIDERRTYLKRLVRLLGLVVPLVLIVNSAVGLLGFINLVSQISWYEGVFLFVLACYLVTRGLFIEVMEFVSNLMISHVPNGWLWREAILKPLDRVMRIGLFLLAGAWIFICYGWDRQSPVVERLSKLIHYQFGEVFNTVITPLQLIELVVIISLLYWAAKWTREFVYRLLLSRTQDLGIRNSVAILSQYAMVVIGILIGLRILGVDFRALTVVAGAFAVTAGLGLRDLVTNLASGFLLLIERPLRVGDMVTIGEYEGEVTHIGSRAVIMRTWDHIEIFIPNADICSKPFVNWTAKDNIARTVVKVPVAQTDSPLYIQRIIHEVLRECKNVLKDPVPEVFLKGLADGTIEFEVRYFVNVRLIKSRASVRSEVLLAIWEAFEKHQIKPNYPSREIFVKEGSSASLSETKETLLKLETSAN